MPQTTDKITVVVPGTRVFLIIVILLTSFHASSVGDYAPLESTCSFVKCK